MSSESQIPVELTMKIGQSLLPGQDVMPEPMPESPRGKARWAFEFLANWLLLVLAIVNLALVLFDFSYIDLRHHYQKVAPQWTALYDTHIKKIEPHRTTQTYLESAEETFALLRHDPASSAAKAALENMQAQSLAMIQEDPFARAHLSGVFEKVKNRMRDHMNHESARQSFREYWSTENLVGAHLAREEAFFAKELRPLLARNYYRDIGENGKPYDAFWMIDLLFIPFFLLEFVIRGAAGLQAGRYASWKAVVMDRWYDMVYFIPLGVYFVPMATMGPLHLVRMVSVGYRMQRLGLIDLMSPAQAQVGRVMNIVTDMVNFKLLTNYQESITKVDLAKTLQSLTPAQKQELSRFIDRNVTMVVTKVVPAVSPELEALVTRAVYQAMEQSPAYQSLKRLPMFSLIAQQILPSLVTEVVTGTQKSLAASLTDEENRKLIESTIEKLSMTLLEEMARTGTERDIKALAIDVLEQQKRKLLA